MEWHFINQNFKHSAGLGAFFAVAVPSAWIVWTLLIPLSVRQWHRQGIQNIKLLWPSIQCYFLGTGILLVWAVLNDRQPRYAMGGLALILTLHGPLLKWANRPWRVVGKGILIISIIVMMMILITLFSAKQLSYLKDFQLPSRALYYEYPSAIDNLPEGSVIVSLETSRAWHYALYGKTLHNRIVPSTEAVHLFLTDDGKEWILNGLTLNRLGITHLFLIGSSTYTSNGCLKLELVEVMTLNPYNQHPLPQPRVLYRLAGNECFEDAIRIPRFSISNHIFTPFG